MTHWEDATYCHGLCNFSVACVSLHATISGRLSPISGQRVRFSLGTKSVPEGAMANTHRKRVSTTATSFDEERRRRTHYFALCQRSLPTPCIMSNRSAAPEPCNPSQPTATACSTLRFVNCGDWEDSPRQMRTVSSSCAWSC